MTGLGDLDTPALTPFATTTWATARPAVRRVGLLSHSGSACGRSFERLFDGWRSRKLYAGLRDRHGRNESAAYLIIGRPRCLAAVSSGGKTAGTKGAFRSVLEAPLSDALLAVVALGLPCFCGLEDVPGDR